MPAFITLGRVLFATADFIAAKVMIPDLLVPYTTQLESMTGMQTPQLLAIATGSFEILSGLMIALNFAVRFFAILMIIFVGVVTFYFHDFWNQTPPDNAKTLIDALKNLSIIGALFMIAGYGRGPRMVEPAYGDV
jgi:putative oxidoreductase